MRIELTQRDNRDGKTFTDVYDGYDEGDDLTVISDVIMEIRLAKDRREKPGRFSTVSLTITDL